MLTKYGLNKLATAIEEGGKGCDRITDDFFSLSAQNKVIGCCALGAAALALGYKPSRETEEHEETEIYKLIEQETGLTLHEHVTGKPFRPGDFPTLWEAVALLNDEHDLDFETTSGWLKSIALLLPERLLATV